MRVNKNLVEISRHLSSSTVHREPTHVPGLLSTCAEDWRRDFGIFRRNFSPPLLGAGLGLSSSDGCHGDLNGRV